MKLFCDAVLYLSVFLSSWISCRFLILFSSCQNRIKYYVIYTAVNVLLNHLFFHMQFDIPQIIGQFMGVLIAFVFSRFVLRTGPGTALLTGMLNSVVFGIYNIAAFALQGILFRETQMSGYWIIGLSSAAILILSGVTLEVFIRRYGKNRGWNGRYSILYSCPLAFIYIMMQTLIELAYNPVTVAEGRLESRTSTAQDVNVLVTVGISLISIYVILHFYERVMEQIEAQNKMSALEAYTEMQKQYIHEAKQKYEKTKAFRHDIYNHMATLSGLVECNEIGKAREYLNRFKKDVRELSFEVLTGNEVIDVLFKEKLGFAREQGIKVLCDASIPKELRVDDFDLCIIFFNALDNAIKGCEYADEKLIDVAAKRNKDFFVIDIINSFHPSKYQKGSGTGVEIIQFITEKYGGYIDICADKEIFRVSIMFSLK